MSALKKITLLMGLSIFFSSCISEPSDGGRKTNQSKFFGSIGVGEGRVFTQNPAVLSGNLNLDPKSDLTKFFGRPQFITNSPTLIYNCPGQTGSSNTINNCFRVRDNENNNQLLNSFQERWDYRATAESGFLQVNMFYHGKKAIDRHVGIFNHAYSNAIFDPAPPYESAVPGALFSQKAQWYNDSQTQEPLLESFANCDVQDNAFFDPAKFQLCFGTDSFTPELKFAQDPSVIYHEFGHTFQQITINARTIAHTATDIKERVNLGQLGYDEAGSIGEGLGDFWSYVLTPGNRTHFAEWSLGINNKLSRPMSESDPIHIAGVNADQFSRLSYQDFLNYDPNNPSANFEDIHNAGQIASHFLVALTEEFKSVCQMTGDQEAVNNVMYILTETMMELGDLSAKGTDGGVDRVNLNANHAKEWYEKANPVNFRRFFQVFAKYTLKIFGDRGFRFTNGELIANSRCPKGPGNHYPQDNLEKLLDSYGLLLFENYNFDGNNATTGHNGPSPQVNFANRTKSVTVPKSFIDLTAEPNKAKFLVFDDRQNIVDSLATLKSTAQIGNVSSYFDDELRFNNGNGRFSPGEIAGLSFVLFNSSNSPMAGIQVLANDWDHTKKVSGKTKMCPNFGDNFPSPSEGAADITSETGNTPGECTYVTRSNGDDGDNVSPICFVQVTENSTAVWASQDVLRKNMGLEPHQCLGGINGNNDECFVRVIKGADQAVFSKIDPQKTWAQTQLQGNGETKEFAISNLIFFEISPQIPPATKFVCRFRVRFSNCSDCYNTSDHNGDNFLDFEYSGGKPFKIIKHEFQVTD